MSENGEARPQGDRETGHELVTDQGSSSPTVYEPESLVAAHNRDEFDADVARDLTNAIAQMIEMVDGLVDKLRRMLQAAHDCDVHTILGYPSWSAYVATEFKDAGWHLERDQRHALVAALTGMGMSTRAIAPVVGVHHSTVVRDLAAPGGADAPSGPVTGLDGKTYSRMERDTQRALDDRWAIRIERISATIPFGDLADADLDRALGAAEFLFHLLRGQSRLRRRHGDES